MDFQDSGTHNNVLERILLDENAEPVNLTSSFLEDITNRFSVDCQIGSGGFAVVYKGTVGKLRVAVKKLTKTHELPESKFHKEVECLMKAKHRNIVRFLGYCAETQGKVQDCEGRFVMADMRNWMLCFEYVPNGSLENYITDASSGLQWQERFAIIRGICHGLQYLHKNRILHLDLKPANILIDDRMQPKISDFGLSRCLDIEQTRVTTIHLSGTLGYLAPEFFRGKVSFASDIYSLGIVIVEILTGAKDYPEVEDVTQSWMNRLEGDTQLEQVRICTKIGIECMESDPKKRPPARHIIDMLDKTASADETGTSNSLVELQVNLLKERSDQESIGELAQSFKLEDINEQPETEDVEEYLGNDPQEGEENTGHVSPWESQDKDKSRVLDKLSFFSIFRKDSAGKQLRGVKNFTKREMQKITRQYSTLIGKGSFGDVYKGSLPDYTIVAVRILRVVGINTNDDFFEVLENQTELRHKNILRLMGCCLVVDGHAIIVYEFVRNGDLHKHLYDKTKVLSWEMRYRIVKGLCSALRYLHHECPISISHNNIKPSNILLDDEFNAMLGDFGPSKDAQGVRFRRSSDVHSFGMVLLEIAHGEYDRNKFQKMQLDRPKSFVEYFADTRLVGQFDKEQMERVIVLGLRCADPVHENRRPSMLDAMEFLDRGGELHPAMTHDP